MLPAHKPITTSRLLTNIKDEDKLEDTQGAVKRIKSWDGRATYIGETCRNLSTRLTEHKRVTRKGDVNNHIDGHHLQTTHEIDWDSATCITYSTDDYYQRLTLESWFTNLEQTPLNRSRQSPTKDLLAESSKTNYERTTGQLTIWLTINDCLRTVPTNGKYFCPR